MNIKTKYNIYNWVLISTIILGHIPTLFFGMKHRLNLSLFVERSTRIDFFALHYCNYLSFLALAFCVYKARYINRNVSKFILVVSILDFGHLVLFAGQSLFITKLGIAYIICFYKDIWSYSKKIINLS